MFAAAVLRLAILLCVLVIVYMALLAWTRYTRKRELESMWNAGEGGGVAREEYIADGMAAWERSPERRILYGVFVLPMIVAISLTILAQ